MLPKENRNNKKEVAKIFTFGKNLYANNIYLKFLLENTENKKISFVVPKNISKKATERNLLRRRGYFAIKKNIKIIPKGFCGVFVFQKKALTTFSGRKNKKKNPFLNIENEIQNICHKIN